jgi:cobalamin synthase
MPFGVLFLLTLVTGTALWDEMASLAPTNPADWTGVIVSAALCVVFFFLSRRKWPLLLCAAFLISVRLTFVFAESVPSNGIGLTADCLGACTALSVIVFRTEIASMWRGVRGRFGERVSPAECAPRVAASV